MSPSRRAFSQILPKLLLVGNGAETGTVIRPLRVALKGGRNLEFFDLWTLWVPCAKIASGDFLCDKNGQNSFPLRKVPASAVKF